MNMRLALCQRKSIPNDVHGNLHTIMDDVDHLDADLLIYPELFLTGYTFDEEHIRDQLNEALASIQDTSRKKDVSILVGAPEISNEGIYNCAYMFTSGTMETYRKIHLPEFGPFTEKSRFIPGSEPISFTYKGFTFGLCICYDLFFPELMKHCTMCDGADVIICISASPVTSRTAFERVLPARAVENTTYVAYVNNIGTMGELEFFGGSRLLDPGGNELGTIDGEDIMTFELDKNVIENARKMRPVIKDSRF